MSATHDVPKVRVLVVGDSGVGKSALTHLLCNGPWEGGGTNPFNAEWTVGCSVDVKLHEYKGGGGRRKEYFVEFFDVGGSKKYEPSRDMFYSQINGILLVFDVTNRKSYSNLRRWIRQIVLADKRKSVEESYAYTRGDLLPGSHSPNVSRYAGRADSVSPSPHVAGLGIKEKQPPPARRARPAARLGSLPVLVVGNKMDLHEDAEPPRFNSLKEFGLECVYTSSVGRLHDDSQRRLDAFFNRVIERRFHRAETPGQRLVFSPLGNFVQRRESVHQLSELDGPLAATSPLPPPAVGGTAAAAGVGAAEDSPAAGGGGGSLPSSYARVAGAHRASAVYPYPSGYPNEQPSGPERPPAGGVFAFRPAGLGAAASAPFRGGHEE